MLNLNNALIKASNTSLKLNKGESKMKLPETQEEFEAMLDELRPVAKEIQVATQRNGDGTIGAIIWSQSKVLHFVDPVYQNEEAFQEELERIVSFYKNPPRLWAGCRGSIARLYRVKMTTQFNKWFDNFATNGKAH